MFLTQYVERNETHFMSNTLFPLSIMVLEKTALSSHNMRTAGLIFIRYHIAGPCLPACAVLFIERNKHQNSRLEYQVVLTEQRRQYSYAVRTFRFWIVTLRGYKLSSLNFASSLEKIHLRFSNYLNYLWLYNYSETISIEELHMEQISCLKLRRYSIPFWIPGNYPSIIIYSLFLFMTATLLISTLSP